MSDFPEIGSNWQKKLDEGAAIESRRVTRVVREDYPPADAKSQNVWIYYLDSRGSSARAELQDWRRWAVRATKVLDGAEVVTPEITARGTLQ